MNLIESVNRNGPTAPTVERDDETEDLRSRLERASAPASDRLVRLDHNSKEFKDFEKAFGQLKEKLERANDLGNLTPEEADVAKQEVSQFGSQKPRDWIRPGHLWTVAKSTFLWIAQQAAGSIVGALALSALAALATLLGVAF